MTRLLIALLGWFALGTLVGCGEEQGQADPAPAQEEAAAASDGLKIKDAPVAGAAVAFPEHVDLIRIGDLSVPERTPGTVRIATYNVENLFDAIDDPALSGDVEDIDDTKPDEHIEMVARAIRAADADVIGLQEIESREALDWFLSGWLSDAGYEHVVSIDSGDARGIENAVISRFPIVESEVYSNMALQGVHPPDASDRRVKPGDPLVMRRGPLRVVVDLPEIGETTLFVVHHKSGGKRTAYWRGAEAFGVGELIKGERESTGRPVLLMGDMNSTPEYETHQKYHGILGLADLVAEGGNESPTHASNRRIDMVYGSPSLGERVVEGTGFVLGTPIRREGQDWRTTPPPAGWASDHFIVGVDLRVGGDS